ncbi:hypothetical protein RB195_022053 [Necator americanus]|uniref:Uncharacterized protein n=1 Tax=Necator americanus TaxID=51031 RepID=A0ABR1EDS1_NECAM
MSSESHWCQEVYEIMATVSRFDQVTVISQQVVIIEIDAKMGLEQKSDLVGKWYYPAECTSDNDDLLVDLREQTAS